MSHWEAEIGDGQDERKRATETEKRNQNPPLPLPLFIYTPKDSRLRFLAPKHTSRLLFPSEVPHSTERLGDRAEASRGQGTSVQPAAQPLRDISHFGHLCQESACVHGRTEAERVLVRAENVCFVRKLPDTQACD